MTMLTTTPARPPAVVVLEATLVLLRRGYSPTHAYQGEDGAGARIDALDPRCRRWGLVGALRRASESQPEAVQDAAALALARAIDPSVDVRAVGRLALDDVGYALYRRLGGQWPWCGQALDLCQRAIVLAGGAS